MTKTFQILKLITLFTLFITFYSCNDDESLIENDTKSYHLKTSRLSINQVINEINNKEIKQKLQITNLSTSQYNSLLRSNDLLDYFIKKEKDDELTTYILNLNSYSQLKPYFLKLIITKNKNETEKMGFLKYIPTSPVSSLDMATFTGKIEILDTNLEINATSEYVNGIKQISNQSNGVANRMVCVDELLITEVKCSHTNTHGVGQPCAEGYINDAHYVVSLFTRCNTDRTIPTQIIEDSGNPNSGTSSFSNTAYLYSFVDSLSQEELAIYVTNPSIQDYLVSNLVNVEHPNYNPILGGDPYMVIIKAEAKQFVKELMYDMINFTDPEGEDNGDEFNYNDYSDIQTTTQTLPDRNLFYSHFPKVGTNGMPSSQVYQLVGGHPYQAYLAGNPNYQNACALRISRALNYSGNIIPIFKNNNNEQKTERGTDNLNYILDASSLLAYLKKTFPNSTPIHLVNKTPTEIKTALNGKWGIYIMIPKNRATFGASGHADFWSNTGCLSGCYFDKAKEVYFWELF